MDNNTENSSALYPGKFYRTSELRQNCIAASCSVKSLLAENKLQKISRGLYYCPEMSRFGSVPADAYDLVKNYLNTDQFLITSFNEFNKLGVGTTQLYNERLVYNQKRKGVIKLGQTNFTFKRKPRFPLQLTQEYLLIDLLNNIDLIAEDAEAVFENAKRKIKQFDPVLMSAQIKLYGNLKTKTLLK